MNMQANAIPESPLQAQPTAPVDISVARRMYWSIRRELWEYRSIYLAPLAVAAVFLFGFMISTIHLPARVRALDAARLQASLQQPYDFVALLIMLTTTLIAVFYCLEAFQGERRDRSALFWKSLPVSDLTTVLAKATIPIVIIPLISFGVTMVTQWVMFLVNLAVLAGSGVGTSTLSSNVPLGQMQVGLLFHLIAIHGLWFAPIYGWLMMVSAWARRVAFLWATLPLLVIGFVEKIAFNTSHFGMMLGHRVDNAPGGDVYPGNGMAMPQMGHLPGAFLASPGLWIGLALTAAFLIVAARMRRSRGPV